MALPLDAKRGAVGIRGADVCKEERIIKAAGARILHRNGAIDSLPGAAEINANGLGDIERGVRQDIELGMEIADAQCAREGGHRKQHRERESHATERSSSRLRGAKGLRLWGAKAPRKAA